MSRPKNFLDVIAGIVLLSVAAALSSCASIFPEGRDVVPLFAPDSVRAFGADGSEIPILRSGPKKAIGLTAPGGDSLRIVYRGAMYEVSPAKSPRLLILVDYAISLGLFSFMDDISGNSTAYTKVSFDTVQARSEVLGSDGSYHEAKPTKLFAMIEGNIPSFSKGGEFPIAFGYAFGYGVGLRRNEKTLLELVEQFEWLGGVDLTDAISGKDFTCDFFTNALKLRVYPYEGFYLSGGFGWDRASRSSSVHTSFNQVQFDVGYSGEWTFIEYERAFGILKRVQFGANSASYNIPVVRIGLKLRFP